MTHTRFGTGFTKGQEQSDEPDARGLAQLAQKPAVDICRHVYGGTETMREAGRTYLRQHPKEEDDAYADRLGQATLFNALRRTVKGVTGLVFRRDPVVNDDVPEPIVGHLDNVDLAGRDLSTFLKALFKSKTKEGHAHIFVDWHGPGDARRQVDEEGARPYWTLVEKHQVLRFRTRNENGKTVLTRVAWIEADTVPDGTFTERLIFRVRQYDLEDSGKSSRVAYRSWIRDAETKGDWEPEVTDTTLGKRMTRIPLVTDYADRTGFMLSNPPLLDLAHLNVKHWWKTSEHDQSLGIAGIPIFTVIGPVKKTDIATFTVGSAIGLLLPENATAGYTETSGQALDAMRQDIQDIEHHMAALGLSLLVRRSGRPQTAEAERLNRAEQDSELADSARGTQDAAAQVLELHAMWMGLDEGGTVGINRDFEIGELTAEMVKEFRELWVEGGISWETLVDKLVQGEALPEGFDPELERARLQEDMQREMAAVMGRREEGDAEDEGDDEEDADMDEAA